MGNQIQRAEQRLTRFFHCGVLVMLLTQANVYAEGRGLAPLRADITDRNGVVLATTVRVPSLYANPKRIADAGAVAAMLGRLVPGVDERTLMTKLSSGQSFVWIARHISDGVAQSVAHREFPGVGVITESMRRYPQGPLASHVVGFTDGDAHHGMAGVEGAFDRVLNDGKPVQLSVDVRLQEIVRDELAKAMRVYRAKGAAGLVFDAQTSEALAFVSLPDFDANDRSSIGSSGYANKLTSNVYEMGGVFEIFSVALALDQHKVTPTTLIDVGKPFQLGTWTLRDDDPVTHPVSVAESFARSSVIGAAHIALTSTPDEQKAFMQRLGLLTPMRVELIETVGRPLFHAENWNALTRTTIGYGYGIAVTPLQAAAVATAVMNHGRLIAPTVINRTSVTAASETRVVSEETSSQMRALLRVVVTDGTGKAADVAGMLVGGKTGTSLKQSGARYDKERRVAWFVAGFPMNDTPRYTLLVMLDEPQPTEETKGKATAQWNTAPVAGRIITRMAPLMHIAPDAQRIAWR